MAIQFDYFLKMEVIRLAFLVGGYAMVLLDIKLDNFLVFKDFEICTSYPKKIVDSGIGKEHIEGKPNFRYKKLIILMGANATGKTALGRILMTIFNFIANKEYSRIVELIDDNEKEAVFSLDFVQENTELYRISGRIAPKAGDDYQSGDIKVSVKKTAILANDNYEKCVERLERESEGVFPSYIEALESIPKISWGFEFPHETNSRFLVWRNRKPIYLSILKQTLMTLDPRIIDVVSVPGDQDVISIRYPHCSVLMNKGRIIDKDILSKGTVEGIGIAELIAAMKTSLDGFYYVDEKFSHIHSEAEKAFLSLLIDLIGTNQQLFITTHNSDILDMNIPKHSFAFLRRDETDNNHISCVFASEYLKKNTLSVKNAVENDVFSSAPDLSGIYKLKEL